MTSCVCSQACHHIWERAEQALWQDPTRQQPGDWFDQGFEVGRGLAVRAARDGLASEDEVVLDVPLVPLVLLPPPLLL
eukprot:SAG31_NODE_7367_length_1708_cov_5.615911_2_plen_78_part_00